LEKEFCVFAKVIRIATCFKELLEMLLEKLLEGSFSPKPLFLAFTKNMESLWEMLLDWMINYIRFQSRIFIIGKDKYFKVP
jgi:hypothetical protein